jgi:hypothetical protein
MPESLDQREVSHPLAMNGKASAIPARAGMTIWLP